MSGEGKGREGEADPAAGIPVLSDPSGLPGRGGSLGHSGGRSPERCAARGLRVK